MKFNQEDFETNTRSNVYTNANLIIGIFYSKESYYLCFRSNPPGEASGLGTERVQPVSLISLSCNRVILHNEKRLNFGPNPNKSSRYSVV